MSHPFNGLVIGQAGRATRALLDRLLQEANTDFPTWVALVLLSDTDIPEDELTDRLATRLKVDRADAALTVTGLAEEGLTTPGATLTEQGRARFQHISDGVDSIAARLYGDLNADEKDTAGRVLALVTARAEAELAA
ncbi:DNA-binding MarR family transcriptional regulator [Actinokineospora baliensis]|uniref:hypothetical protein n=1 Tax=Actinokineospora baliensis TaxID=547056 RepID=UPI001958A4A7|nr:hypothetical protein [Actinokineospora baliensis]MBM7774612.1 DNA-binding MarR family transcriptional regulator [Actinokineospora baliensis]